MAAARFDKLDAWLSWMETMHPSEIDLGLDRTKAVAAKLDVLRFDATVVTVAGTNGKGSFVKALSDLLLHQGTTFGAYTSPHINSYNERIRLQGVQASDQMICEAFDQIDRARGDISLTYFEFGTLASLVLFKQAQLDVVILEVGLGGRLDAVNIVDPDISIITSIGIDHIAWLGTDRESIGAEKAGILRRQKPFVCVESDPPQSVINVVNELGCESYFLGDSINVQPVNSSDSNSKVVNISGSAYDSERVFSLALQSKNNSQIQIELRNPSLPLPSLLAAAQVYLLLDGLLSEVELSDVLSAACLEGRMEYCESHNQVFILDVAHNPQAADMLANNIHQLGYENIVAVFAAMQDKDIKGMLAPLASVVDQWVCTEVSNMPRSWQASALANELRTEGLEPHVEVDVVEAIKKAQILTSDVNQMSDKRNPIVILGSFYLVSEFKARFFAEEGTV